MLWYVFSKIFYAGCFGIFGNDLRKVLNTDLIGEGKKRIFCKDGFTVLLSFFLFFSLVDDSLAGESMSGCSASYSSLVLDERSGNVLFETRSENTAYPASLVKVMTLYLTFEAIENHSIKPEQILYVSEVGEEVSKVNKNNTMHLKAGDKITVREAIHGVIVKSFNEAAVTLAEAVAGSEWEFVRKMNAKAAELGMNNTSFRNASGLHAEGQYTTSYDLARLAIAIRRDFPNYYHLFSLKEFTYKGTKYETHNHVLVEYKGADGMKTGFTNASGFNLITAAKKDDKRVISVLLGCSSYKSRDRLTKKLLDDAFHKMAHKNSKEGSPKLVSIFGYDKSEEEVCHKLGEY